MNRQDFEYIINTLDKYSLLDPNWDGFDCVAPNSSDIAAAKEFLSHVYNEKYTAPIPMLSSDGEVGFYWIDRNIDLYIDLGFLNGEFSCFSKLKDDGHICDGSMHNQYEVDGRVFRFVGAQGKQFRYLVNEAVKPHFRYCQQFHGATDRLRLHIQVRPPDKRRRDLDNLVKSVQDALQEAGVYRDDEQIDDLHVVRSKDDIVPDGEIIITLSSIAGRTLINP